MGQGSKFKIFSNFKGFDHDFGHAGTVTHEWIGTDQKFLPTLRLAWKAIVSGDCLVFNIEPKRLLITCAVFAVLAPRAFRRCKLISVDLLLRPESGWKGWFKLQLKSLLLRQVDGFILYFKNWDGYAQTYHLPRERMVYVPFKVNSWEQLERTPAVSLVEDYVLCAGATFRDHETFIEAVRLAGVPGVLLLPGSARKDLDSFAWYRKPLPPNLKLEFHDDGKEETYLGYFARAKIVCIPRFKWDIASTGISAYLYAMAIQKCVVISRGPGAEDVLPDETAQLFEPENFKNLAEVLEELWGNTPKRRRIALNGYHYAIQLQGEQRLLRDILAVVLEYKTYSRYLQTHDRRQANPA